MFRIHDVGKLELWIRREVLGVLPRSAAYGKKHSAFFLGSPGSVFVSTLSSFQEKVHVSGSADHIHRLGFEWGA